jgi:hypothetical protein
MKPLAVPAGAATPIAAAAPPGPEAADTKTVWSAIVIPALVRATLAFPVSSDNGRRNNGTPLLASQAPSVP